MTAAQRRKEREARIAAGGKRFKTMLGTLTKCGADIAPWFALHIGQLTARVEMLEATVRALKARRKQ